MSSAYRVLGSPVTQHITADTTGAQVTFPGKLVGLQIYNQGANALRVYWTEADFGANLAAGVNYLPMAANGSPGDFFDRDLTFSPGSGLWLRAAAATSLVIVTAFIEY